MLETTLLLVALGVAAGLMTTLGGFGGGQFLVTCLALIWSPIAAITVATMALLLGNSQRLFLFRHDVNWRFVVPLLVGVIPGAIGGALLAAIAPTGLLRGAIAVGALLALVRVVDRRPWQLPRVVMGPLATTIGFLSATTGGGGFLLGTLVQGAGVRGNAYVASLAATSISIHIFKLAGYSTGGLLRFDLGLYAVVIALSLMTGNFLGWIVRKRLGEDAFYWLEFALPGMAGLLALVGLLRFL